MVITFLILYEGYNLVQSGIEENRSREDIAKVESELSQISALKSQDRLMILQSIQRLIHMSKSRTVVGGSVIIFVAMVTLAGAIDRVRQQTEQVAAPDDE